MKLADGTWLVGGVLRQAGGYTRYTSEFFLDEVHWIKLDMGRIVTRGEIVKDHPDLGKVDEIGFTDDARRRHGLGRVHLLGAIEVTASPSATLRLVFCKLIL